MPRYTVFASACALIILFAGSAVATSPAPAFEKSFVFDGDYGYVATGINEKGPRIGEKCIPRGILCVGPYEPDFDYRFGPTGLLVDSNNSNVTVGHDPKDHAELGPYAFPTLFQDDLRICWNKCPFPRPGYASVWLNLTVTAYVDGRDQHIVSYQDDLTVVADPYVIPRSHCHWSYNGCPR